jgi:Sulfotransferase family
VVIVGSGRCGSTLLQSILNANPEFLIWGEHNGFLRQIASAYYEAAHPRFPDKSELDAAHRIQQLRNARRWPAWDNLCGEAEFLGRFRDFIRSFFADPAGRAVRWGFKEIRYSRDPNDHALRLMFECFPAMRLIVLVREPEATIFSSLSHWVFAGRREANIDVDELDQLILGAAHSWNVQYMHLHVLSQAHRPNCLQLQYEELGSPQAYQKLSTFLETSPFDYQRHLGKVKDASNKTDPTAVRVRQRIEQLQPQIADATCEGRAAYGYASAVLPR